MYSMYLTDHLPPSHTSEETKLPQNYIITYSQTIFSQSNTPRLLRTKQSRLHRPYCLEVQNPESNPEHPVNCSDSKSGPSIFSWECYISYSAMWEKGGHLHSSKDTRFLEIRGGKETFGDPLLFFPFYLAIRTMSVRLRGERIKSPQRLCPYHSSGWDEVQRSLSRLLFCHSAR
jgi:hypothetical protein